MKHELAIATTSDSNSVTKQLDPHNSALQQTSLDKEDFQLYLTIQHPLHAIAFQFAVSVHQALITFHACMALKFSRVSEHAHTYHTIHIHITSLLS